MLRQIPQSKIRTITMFDWNTIKTVMLDMDGTLLDLHYDNYFWLEYLPQHYAVARDMDEATAREQLRHRFQSERGKLHWYCIDYWSEQLGIDVLSLKHDITDRIGYLPQARQLLDHCRQSPVETLIVTNAHRKILALKESVIPLSTQVDRVWSSHDFGHPKEDLAFWHALSDAQRFDPSSTLFVDDNDSVLDAAARYGIAHLARPLRPDSQRAAQTVNTQANYRDIESLADLLQGI